MQAALPMIWIRIADSISYDHNRSAKHMYIYESRK